MDNCLFCKIVAKEFASTPVYEDDAVYAFLDINPVNPGHTLVVPKIHYSGFIDADEETLSRLISAMQKVARAIVVAFGADGFNLEENNGEIAGQLIPHLHFHVVPRLSDDGLKHWPGKPYAEGEAEVVAEKIREAL
ncbi:MAG: HIT family protein [Patescibacteria group bacterium]